MTVRPDRPRQAGNRVDDQTEIALAGGEGLFGALALGDFIPEFLVGRGKFANSFGDPLIKLVGHTLLLGEQPGFLHIR